MQVDEVGNTAIGGQETHAQKRSTWFQAAMIIVGSIIGTGVLGLPKVRPEVLVLG